MRIGSGIPTDDAISHSRWPSWCAELIEKREGDEQNTGHMAPSTREQIHRFIEDATSQTGRMNKGGWKELYKIGISADFTMVGL